MTIISQFDLARWHENIVSIAQNDYECQDCSSEVARAGYSLKEQIKVLERIYSGEKHE